MGSEAMTDLIIYLPNCPPCDPYQNVSRIAELPAGEWSRIVEETGNHWRKIFNLSAKLGFGLEPMGYDSWQQWRDHRLFVSGCPVVLDFEMPAFDDSHTSHYISGFGHAEALGYGGVGEWSRCGTFRVDHARRLIIGPYLDYRQLSNAKLEQLLSLLLSFVISD